MFVLSKGEYRVLDSYMVLSVFVVLVCLLSVISVSSENEYVSALGDSGMKRDGLRLAIEAWNQCNEVGEEAPNMRSPRAADCFDVYKAVPQQVFLVCRRVSVLTLQCNAIHASGLTEKEYRLGAGQPFIGVQGKSLNNVDLYAADKELYLGNKCQVEDTPNPWQFWMIMLKSGNMDAYANACSKKGHKVGPFGPTGQFPCFGKGCMNHPLIYHNYTTLQGPNQKQLKGSFYGSWDLDADLSKGIKGSNVSYHSMT